MSDLSTKEAFELYENGKHRRYNLLFSVNGGAFAIAKLLTREPGNAGVVLGKLTLSELSIGMALFTVVMIADIYAFGDKMRKNHLPGAFALVGKIVLLLLGVLVCAAWLLVGFGSGTRLESLSTRRYLFCTRGENLSTDRSIFCTGLEAMLAMKAYRLLCRAARTNRCHSCSASGERSPLPRF